MSLGQHDVELARQGTADVVGLVALNVLIGSFDLVPGIEPETAEARSSEDDVVAAR